MLTNKSTKLSNTNYHFNNTNFSSNLNLNNLNTFNNSNPSPKTSQNNIYYHNTNDSQRSKNFNNNLNQKTLGSSSKLLNTYNSASFSNRKFPNLNMNTNASKTQSMTSSNSKQPLTTYISCSTLQSGIASYSIPKTRRFRDSYKVAYCDSIYSLPEFRQSGVSIGNGKRKDLFDKKQGIPSPLDYVFTSGIEDNLKKKKGFSIARRFKIIVNLVFFVLILQLC